MDSTPNSANNSRKSLNWLLPALALAFTVSARGETSPSAIPFSDIGARATADYQGDALGITAKSDAARLRCGFQKLAGRATPEGLWLESTKPGGGQLRLVAVAVRRDIGHARPRALTEAASSVRSDMSIVTVPQGDQAPLGATRPHWATSCFDMPLLTEFETPFPDVPCYKHAAPNGANVCLSQGAQPLALTGDVSAEDKLVRFIRPGLTEEYSVSADGVRQDFVIESPPLDPRPSTLDPSAGDLRLELTLTGARAETADYGAKVILEGSGRALAYSRLRVEDATGRALTARLEVLSTGRLAVSVADASATYPVRIDPTFSDADWVSLNSGMLGADDGVEATAVDADGNLYVGGYFTFIGTVPANCIAKWDGSAWSALGSGINSEVWALAVIGTNLYAGGGITTAGGVPVANIAKWNGSAWSALGSGITGGPNPGIYALAVSGTNLYAGGWFTTAGGVTVNGIAEWNGSAWSALGSGMSGVGAIVEALAMSGTDLYAGGYFTYAGGVGVMYVARWDGSAWSPVGSGLNGSVSALAVSGTDLFAGGQFTTAGGLPTGYIAKWNGWSWSPLGSWIGGTSYPNAQALATDGAGRLFVGGNFNRAGTKPCSYVAQANVGLSVPTVPVIVSPPTNQNILIGGEVEFSVVAWSTMLIGYQWFFGTHSIIGATNTVLRLTNVQPSQAGVYNVVITNVYGATTSAPAALAVFPPRTVADASEAALRAAMAPGGNVTFSCDGAITLSSTITNNLDVKLDAKGHQVTISGANRVGVFVVHTNVSFTLANLTVAGGGSGGGSAILNLGGRVNLASVAFLSNNAAGTYSTNLTANGGAIWNRGGTVHATNCSFLGNTAQTLPSLASTSPDASALGGAIRNEAGELNLQGCAFVGNRASGAIAYNPSMRPNAGHGGAIHNSGALRVDLCTFTRNSATGGDGSPGMSPYLSGGPGAPGEGGAIYSQGALTVDRTTFSGNSATGGRGGMGAMGDVIGYRDGSPGGDGAEASGGAFFGSGSLSRSLFVSNVVTAGAGGGGGSGYFHVDMGGNGARGGIGGPSSGGAVCGSGSLVNCTLASNIAYGGQGGGGGSGAGFVLGGTGNGANGGDGGSAVGGVAWTCNLTNCTVVGNVGQAGVGGWGGSSMRGKQGTAGTNGSAYGAADCGPMPNSLIASNTPAGGDTFTDPKLGPLADNGGPTLTIALLPGSPAIDAGDNSAAPPTDQRGVPRPFSLAADIGAFEFWPTLRASTTGSGSVDILASGINGQTCRLLTSSNSLNWMPLATNQIGTHGTVLFFDNYVPGSPCRFYRLVMP